MDGERGAGRQIFTTDALHVVCVIIRCNSRQFTVRFLPQTTAYVATLHRAFDISCAEEKAKSYRESIAKVSSSMAVLRSAMPKLQADVENGQQLLLIWCCLASSASRLWIPAKMKLKALAEAWKSKQAKAFVIQAAILRIRAQNYLHQVKILDKFGPKMVLRAKIARKRAAIRIVRTFITECKSVYEAVKSVKRFRRQFCLARAMVLHHLESKYHRVWWLMTYWNKLERNRLLASR